MCLAYAEGIWHIENMVGSAIAPPDDVYALEDYLPRNQWCVDALKSGEVDLFITGEAHLFKLENCGSVVVAPNILVEPSLVYAATNSIDIMVNVSHAMDTLRQSSEYYEALNTNYHYFDSCDDTAIVEDASEQIDIASMTSVFLLFFANAAVAVALAVVDAWRRRRCDAKSEESDASSSSAKAASDAPAHGLTTRGPSVPRGCMPLHAPSP